MIREPKGNARDLTIIFAFANIAYLTSVVVLYDFTDQNRILFEVFPLFAVLLGSLIVVVMRRSRRSHLSMDRGRARENSSIPHE
jgi:cytochrome c-type biogenesis protein CcmH/NrfF